MTIVTRTWMINGRKPIAPGVMLEQAFDHDWPIHWRGVVNGISSTRGRQAGEANFLVFADDLNSMLEGPNTISCDHEGGLTNFPGWYVEEYKATTKQSKPAFWVRLKDKRMLLEHSSAQGRSFNLRKNSTEYIPDTINSGTPWTWQGVLQQLWDYLPADIAGDCPTIPSIALSSYTVPENLCFDGIGAWRAINQVLTAIGCAIVLDPFTSVFSIVALAVDDELLQPRIASLTSQGRLLWTDRAGAGRFVMPNVASVLFHRTATGSDIAPFRQPYLWESTIPGNGSGKYELIDTTFYYPGRESYIMVRTAQIAVALAGLLEAKAKPLALEFGGVVEIKPSSRLSRVTWISDGEHGMVTKLYHQFERIDWPKLPLYDVPVGGMIQGPVYEAIGISDGSGSGSGGTGLVEITIQGAPPHRPDILGLRAFVRDLSPCIFDLEPEDLEFVWVWAIEQVHAGGVEWCAVNRCCVEEES